MDVTAKFRADISDMKSKMDSINRSLGGMQGATKKAQGGFTILKGAMGTAFGGAIIGGVFAAGKAIGDFAGASIDAASTMEELESKVNAIFGAEAGAEIAAWSETASKAFGQSQIQAQNAASTFAIFGKGAGLAGSDLVDFSTGLTELSSDLASFYDASPEEAIGAIGAALRGETEPIRRFGVMLDAASMQQKAFEMGIISSTNEALLPQQKALAAQALIMEQTADAQGDFARTSDGLANSQRTLEATLEDVKTQVGEGLLPAIGSIVQAVGPMLQQLAGPLGQVAEQIGGVLSEAFQQIAPILPTVAETLGQIAATVGGALAQALGTLIPALQPILQAFQNLAAQIAPLLSKVLGKVAEILGRVLGAVTPLLGPLTDLVMGILDAAWPIIETVADVLLTLVDALMPVLDAVMMLIKPLGDLIQVALAAFLPIIRPILPVIEALANVLGQILVKAIGLLLIQVGALIQAWSKVAPFILNNVAKPVLKHFFNMAEGVVGAAAEMMGWVPGLGDALKDAEVAVREFAAESQKAVGQAADTIAEEGTRIGQEMVTQGQNALAGAGPALGNSAAQLGRYVAGQYNYAVASGMGKAFAAMGGDVPAPAPIPEPVPDPAPTPSGTPTGASEADKQEERRLERMQKFVDGFQKALERMQRGQQSLLDSTKRTGSEFAGILEEMLPTSAVQDAFGPSGSIGSVISQYDQLDASIEDLYKPLTNAKRFGKETAKVARGLMNDAKGFLKAATETALALRKQKAENLQALEDLDDDYSTAVDNITDTYDKLDKAAADNIKAIESRWGKAIPRLEAALSATSEAYERENRILEDLQKERDQFLGKVADGFRKFVNDLGGDDGTLRSRLEDRLREVREFAANIRTLVARGLDPTLVREFVSAGVSGAGAAAAELATASQSDIQAINQVQSGLASEIAGFQEYASKQWFDAGIAQQEAIVAPLAAARDQAQAALDAANAARTAELAAARAHAEKLREDRQKALDAAKKQYEEQKETLKQQGLEIDEALTANANNLHNEIAALQESVPPEMMEAGKKSVTEMLAGFQEEFPGMKKKLNRMMDNLAKSMNRTATIEIRHKTVFETQRVGFMAKGGPVQANNAYVVGEKGPELFMPNRAGNIIPNHKLGSVPNMSAGRGASRSDGTTINLTVNAGMGADGAEVGRHVVEALKRYERRNGPIPVTTR